MGKLVQVKPGFSNVWLPDGRTYDEGEQATLSDAQYAGLNSAWAARVLTLLSGSISDPPGTIPPGEADIVPERLCIYYGVPANVFLVFDPSRAAQVFSRYELVVFAEGLQDPGHQDHASTVATIAKIKEYNPKTRIFGYVSCALGNGDSAPLTEAQMKARVDGWAAIGVHGMLLDEFGYEYLVPRSLQNAMIDYVHGKNMIAFVNVWNLDDAFSPAVNATYNPTGADSTIHQGDYCLLESWIYNTASYAGPEHNATITSIRTRAEKARTYRDSLGVKWIGGSVVDFSVGDTTLHQHYFDVTQGFARMYAANGWAVDANGYSSGGGAGNIATIKMWDFDLSPLDRRIVPHVSGDQLTLTRFDLPLKIVGTTTAEGTSELTATRPL